ncbi:hypothetical protein [Streptomyces sp. NPDC054866]
MAIAAVATPVAAMVLRERDVVRAVRRPCEEKESLMGVEFLFRVEQSSDFLLRWDAARCGEMRCGTPRRTVRRGRVRGGSLEGGGMSRGAPVPRRLGSAALTGAWIDGWISRVREHLVVYLEEFEARFGYPPDSNSAAIAEEVEEVEEAEQAEKFGGPEHDEVEAVSPELALLYRHMDHLSLPDVGVGIFVHSVRQTAVGLRGDLPTRLAGALDDSVVVFGSDGGGALFALSRTDGATVYQLPSARVEGDIYHCAENVEILAGGLKGFLVYVEDELKRN